jgi:flagellar motor switch protein FliN/FliY
VPAGEKKDALRAPAQTGMIAESLNLPSLPGPEEEEPVATGAEARLPVELDVAVPVRGFKVRRLLALEPGQVIETEWAHSEDMPLAAGHVQLAWSEFEVVDSELAVRITRLA